MKFSWILSLTALLSPVIASPEPASDDAGPGKSTVFNGETVPPMIELKGDEVDKTIAKGYWFVEYFSPWCHHCQAFAPTLQTIYEFYYTSKPLGTGPSKPDGDVLNSFTGYYNFRFAKLDCVAYADGCSSHGVDSYPTMKFYKDGSEIKNHLGSKTLPELSKWIEELLESIKPGSRPPGGPTLPKEGDHSVKQAAPANNVETKVSKPKLSPKANLDGQSVHLTHETFPKKVTATDDPWFIKFYAPWCHHCQAMAPNWKEMAQEMKGHLNIGEVNCEAERKLCHDNKIKGFPTLQLIKGKEVVEYNGLRGVGDLISYAKTAAAAGMKIEDVDLTEFQKLEETEEVMFVYFYDHATVSEDFKALDHLSLPLIGKARLIKSKDETMAKKYKVASKPSLMVWRSSKTSFYPYLAPKDMRDHKQILDWTKTVWQPLVPELTASNAKELMTNSIVVLSVLSRSRSDEFILAKREMKSAAKEWIDREVHAQQLERQELRDAKQLRVDEAEDRHDKKAKERVQQTKIVLKKRSDVKFAWVDGVFWQRWIKSTYGIDVVQDGERVIIVDEDNRRYWDTTTSSQPILPSRSSILETLPRVLARPPKIPPRSSASAIGTIYYRLRASFRYHPLFSTVMLFLAVAATWLVARKYKRRSSSAGMGSWINGRGSGGFLNLDHGEKGFVGNGGGKND